MRIGKTARFVVMYIVTILVALVAGNMVAMNAFLEQLPDPTRFASRYLSIGGVYLNMFSFLGLYNTFGKEFPLLFKQPVSLYVVIVGMGFLGPLLLKVVAKKKRLTSEGTAKWADQSELEEKKLLVSVSKAKKANVTGVVCGTWYTGLVSYESIVTGLRTLTKPLKLSDTVFFTLVDIAAMLLLVSRYYIIDNAPTHGLMVAPSRSGKGIGPVLQTLLMWKGSMIVSDLKRENLRKTGAYRKHVLNHNVIEFAPTDTRPTGRFNPLNEIRWGTANEGKDVGNLVTLLVGEPEGKDAHWKSNAASILIGTIIHLKYKHARMNADAGLEPGDPGYIETSMPLVYEFMTTTEYDSTLDEYMSFKEKLTKELQEVRHFPARLFVHNENSRQAMIRRVVSEERAQEITTFSHEAKKTPHLHPVVNSSFQSFIAKPDDEGGSVLSTAITAISMFGEKIIADNTSCSDWIIGDIRGLDKPTDLFLVVPPSDLGRVAKLFSFIFETIIQRTTEDEEVSQSKHRTLLLIDEWPAFGKMDTLVRELGYIASYGLKCFLICQGLSQVKAIYDNKLAFLTNCETQIYFAPRDEDTPKFLSAALDKETIETKQKSTSGWFSKTNYTYGEKGRLLLTPGEATALGNNAVLIIESLFVKSPKNKWFNNGDMVERMNAGKHLDPHGRIGLRDMGQEDTSHMFEKVRFLTIHDVDVSDFDTSGEPIVVRGDTYNVMSGILGDDEALLQFAVNVARYLHCSYRKHNSDNGLMRGDAGYKELTEAAYIEFLTAAKDITLGRNAFKTITREAVQTLLQDENDPEGEKVIKAYTDGAQWLCNVPEEYYTAYITTLLKKLQ